MSENTNINIKPYRSLDELCSAYNIDKNDLHSIVDLVYYNKEDNGYKLISEAIDLINSNSLYDVATVTIKNAEEELAKINVDLSRVYIDTFKDHITKIRFWTDDEKNYYMTNEIQKFMALCAIDKKERINSVVGPNVSVYHSPSEIKHYLSNEPKNFISPLHYPDAAESLLSASESSDFTFNLGFIKPSKENFYDMNIYVSNDKGEIFKVDYIGVDGQKYELNDIKQIKRFIDFADAMERNLNSQTRS